jgi:hypothetical protein
LRVFYSGFHTVETNKENILKQILDRDRVDVVVAIWIKKCKWAKVINGRIRKWIKRDQFDESKGNYEHSHIYNYLVYIPVGLMRLRL